MRTSVKALLAGVATLAIAASAQAADLPSRAAPAPIIAAVPIFTWTGFYVGANAGYGWNTNDNNNSFYDPTLGYFGGGSSDDGGFVGGGQVGYNYQVGQFVIGVEADIQYADIGGGGNNGYYAGYYYGGNNGSDGWFGTVRARAGLAIDRALIYVTGGFAYGDMGGGGNNNFYYGGSNDDVSTGWTLGGGLEYAIPANWFGSSAVTVGVEGLYVNLDSNSNNNIFSGLGNNRDNGEFGVVRAKLNFKFGTY
jgi:outer membrane immunogenic protein